ncbi:MAG: glycosyltransferase family 2 protein [Planctomycetota bacterium]
MVPIFNEAATLRQCIENLMAIRSETLELDVHLINDGSTDSSSETAAELESEFEEIRVTNMPHNVGKGAAVRTGFEDVRGDYVAIQDADLEYDPRDLVGLLEPLINDEADVVFGSRFIDRPWSSMNWRQRIHCFGNRSLTWLSNLKTQLKLTDMETCYKVFRQDVVEQLKLDENRFAIEPQITSQISKLGVRVVERPISYHGRGYGEGKKIGIRDAFRAAYCILFRN